MNAVEISFPGSAPADAVRLAGDLVAHLRSTAPDVEAQTVSASADAMDFGASVALVIGTPAALALVKGIADWIRRQGDPELVIKTKKGEVTVSRGLDRDAKRDIIMSAIDKGVL